MFKLTASQLLFLEDAIRKAEIEDMVGYPDSNGQQSERDKEIISFMEFLSTLRPGQVLVKEDPTRNIIPSLDGEKI